MKKLLLTLGTVAAVAAPVAAVVACSADKEAYVKVTDADNGKFVMHAFKGAATFANINGNKDGSDHALPIVFRTQDGGTDTALFAALGTATSEADLFTAIENFNDAKLYIPTSFTSVDKDNAGVINALKGKELKAEAFFQQDSRGGATYVKDADALKTAQKAAGSSFALDTTEKSHGISLKKVALRIVVA